MEKNDFSTLKLNLVHYFLKKENFTVYKASSEKYSFLLNKDNGQFQLIVIALENLKDKEKKVIDNVSEKLKNSKHQKINILYIYIGRDLSKSDSKEKEIIISNPIFYKEPLVDFYPKIKDLIVKFDKKEDEEDKVDPEALMQDLSDPENAKDENIKDLVSKIKSGFSPVATFMSLLFVLLPIVSLVASFYFSYKGLGYLSYPQIAGLFFGATDHNLTILGHQYWRILTYGFDYGTSGSQVIVIIEMIFLVYLFHSLARYTEAVIGSVKLLVSFFVSYVLVGFFVSAAIPSGVYGGPYVALSTLVGILSFTSNIRKSAVWFISRGKLIIPAIILLLFPMFDGNLYNYILFILSLGCSGSIIYLFHFNFKKVSYNIIPPFIILLSVLVLPIVLIFLEYLIPAVNSYDVYLIISYLQKGIGSLNHANDLLAKIGWTNLSIQLINNSYVVTQSGI